MPSHADTTLTAGVITPSPKICQNSGCCGNCFGVRRQQGGGGRGPRHPACSPSPHSLPHHAHAQDHQGPGDGLGFGTFDQLLAPVGALRRRAAVLAAGRRAPERHGAPARCAGWAVVPVGREGPARGQCLPQRRRAVGAACHHALQAFRRASCVTILRLPARALALQDGVQRKCACQFGRKRGKWPAVGGGRWAVGGGRPGKGGACL